MRKVIPAVGITAMLFQLIRLWPLSLNTMLLAMITGGLMYLSCKLGWDNQKSRIAQNGHLGWVEWFKRAIRGITIFLLASLALLFFSFHNPICEEFGDSLYGRCEQQTDSTKNTEDATTPFNPISKAVAPLLLAFAYYAGGAAVIRQYTKVKGQIGTIE